MGSKFGVVLADPPWSFKAWSSHGQTRTPDAHFATMTMQELQALDVRSVCKRDAVCFLWVTFPHLEAGLQTMRSWGFRYSTGLPWVKMRSGRPTIGTGYRLRGVAELLLLGVRGTVPKPSTARAGVILCPRGRYAAKPHDQYEFCEQYPGPYIELFARQHPSRPGADWTAVGLELTGRDIREDLRILREGENR